MYLKIKTSPKWIGDNLVKVFGLIGAVWTCVVFLSGWFGGVNATVTGFPGAITRLTVVEKENVEFKSSFKTFMQMYTLQTLGRKSEAVDIAKSLEDPTRNNP